jgi:hypothetical protein
MRGISLCYPPKRTGHYSGVPGGEVVKNIDRSILLARIRLTIFLTTAPLLAISLDRNSTQFVFYPIESSRLFSSER